MKEEIIKIIQSYFDNYVGLKENHRSIDLDDLPEMAEEIAQAIIWHTPDYVPPAGGSTESIAVLNQSNEQVLYDFLDVSWYSADNPSRSAHVEKWRYCEPRKTI